MRWGRALFASCLFTLVLLEVGSCTLARAGVLKIDLPKYELPKWEPSLGEGNRFWADVDPHFGVWHEPNSSYRHKRECFDVRYRANSHGMRDVERTRDGDSRRVVVLGDSLTEGYGVEREQRWSDRLEQSTGVPHLNFGTAGDFGPTQYYLLYKHFAKSFAHDTVMIGMLPFNDFRDDDLEFGKRIYPDRYRPYWVGEHPNYRLIYYRERLGAGGRGEDPPLTWKTFAREFTHGYNAFVFARRMLEHTRHPSEHSMFYDFSERELLRAQHSFAKLREEAAGKRVLLLLLPVASDLARYRKDGPSPLAARLSDFGAQHGIEVVDLLPAMAAGGEHAEYFLPCDGHWSARGHAAAHVAIRAALTRRADR